MKRYLVTAIGYRKPTPERPLGYERTIYELSGRRHESAFAPAALAALLGLEGAEVVVLATEKARDAHFANLARELEGYGLAVPPPIVMEERLDAATVSDLLERLAGRIERGSRVSIDLSLGYRHLPVLFLTAVIYLVGLGHVDLEGIHYGAFDMKGENDAVPVLDLSAAFDLIAWFQALRSFRDSGDADPLARVMDTEVSTLFRSGLRERHLGGMRDRARHLGRALSAALPLEAGNAAARFCAAVEGLGNSGAGFASRLAAKLLQQETRAWALAEPPGVKGSWKGRVRLDEEELRRELELAAWLCTHGRAAEAGRVCREWVVNVVILRRLGSEEWLGHGHRSPAEGFLRSLVARDHEGLATAAEIQVARLWIDIAAERNPRAHAGMCEEDCESSADLSAILRRCRDLVDLDWPTLGRTAARGRLLLTPFGRSPGVLYSATRLVDPSDVVVLTSKEALPHLDESLGKAGYRGSAPVVRLLEDPFAGIAELDRICDRDLLESFLGAEQLVANVAGGTTVMQAIVERCARRGAELGVPVRTVAVVDRRTADEQRLAPYEMGELLDLPAR